MPGNRYSVTTPELSNLSFKPPEGFEKTRPKGFEPLTYGLEIRCSIQLSYGRTPYRKYFVRYYRSQGMLISAQSQVNIAFWPILRQNRKRLGIKLS
jgi:hypothetical protein